MASTQRDLLILNPGYPDPPCGAHGRGPAGRPHPGRSESADAAGPSGIDRRRAAAHAEPVGAGDATRCFADAIRCVRSTSTRPTSSASGPTPPSARSRSSNRRAARRPIGSSSGNYRFPQRNIFLNVNYALGQVKNHADSETSLPANNLDPRRGVGPVSAGRPSSRSGHGQRARCVWPARQREREGAVGRRPTRSRPGATTTATASGTIGRTALDATRRGGLRRGR